MNNCSHEKEAEPLSICIPAYNEERNIAKTLQSAWDAIPSLVGHHVEVLLCANACTDRTVDVAMEWARTMNLRFETYDLDRSHSISKKKNNSVLHILVTAVPGKPNAWNKLKELASGDILLFLDADITLHPQSFFYLIQALRSHPEKKAGAGVVVAPSLSKNLLYSRMRIKMIEFATKKTPYMNGPLYAIRNSALDSIPLPIIHEDAYLTMSLGIDNILTVPHAVAYQVPPNTYVDYYKRRIRDNLSDLQLYSLYGQTYRDFREKTKDRRTKPERESVLSKKDRILKRLLFFQTLLCKILDRWARRTAQKMFHQGKVAWLTCDSTKG